MKLKLMETDIGVVLCDEGGTPLPNQQRVTLISAPDDLSKIHVTFLVGGDVTLDRRSGSKGDR